VVRWRSRAWAAALACVAAVAAGGALDYYTWGMWFSAIVNSVALSGVGDLAAIFGVSPFWWYLPALLALSGGLVLAGVLGLVLSWRATDCQGVVLSKLDEAVKVGPALDVLIRAFAQLAHKRPKAVLALVGPDTGSLAPELRRLMAELDLDPQRVIFTGLLQGHDKMAVLREADIFVLPSHTENFALAAVEAMAMGRPVIVSEGVKIAPDIARAGAGLVVAPEAGALETAMAGLLQDEQKRQRMGAAAFAFAQGYDWPMVVDRLEDSYRAMIAA